MYQIKLTAQAKKELKKIKLLHQKAIDAVFEDLKENPRLGKPLTRELTGKYSYKIGVYRLIYSINAKDKIIFILTAGHRLTIYK
ncbi:hypothetical protein A3A93_05985 [Candidatus Roizmanbacteria bacterium RIFCSPLOWO2_01_FULL_38_12]|uniref:Addiction module toxin RelE n=1 Tax=Candidatus Roizmanbacteria bacterium RIFCSPLOWO2_01_FULL_38_12 TaxID=1802061 RepID=A0A1F7IVC8_9BACT|nr:MAG: hypothetical protein A2861_02985 [Candidatus Roizmanbacteria bacterium RIFCSPHIGHO2_01_FULL_38_15]OGK36268.1 MAG: hypothetical protein A3F59_00125 [Candidatus Roizmanbacteria bacterium RIFCSPHIGHO2_12_FULL_38_13]OGK47307.1 MAG: hypothetical protein A3A93_05985 [Candidatus Roizmanbacteria bacterium RIFCSPLOWO2_01_FULL_38_12]